MVCIARLSRAVLCPGLCCVYEGRLLWRLDFLDGTVESKRIAKLSQPEAGSPKARRGLLGDRGLRVLFGLLDRKAEVEFTYMGGQIGRSIL